MDRRVGNLLYWLWNNLPWIILFAALCGFAVAGCLRPNQPIVSPYDPLTQVGESVKNTNWLVTISILAIALSVAALFNGSKMALGALVGSITSLTVSLMVARYATVIAFVGLFLAVAVLLYSGFIKNRALFEIFNTAEKAKEKLNVETTLEIFKGHNSVAEKLQSSTTKKVVDKLQRKLK